MDNTIVRTSGPELRDGATPFIERRGRRRVIEQSAEPAVSFGELWRILRKRKWIIWTSAFVIFAAALGYTLVLTPKYRTTSIIEFNKSNADSLDLDQSSGIPGNANAMDYSVTQRTQVNALISDTLALQVVHDLNLESRKEFSRGFSPLDYFQPVTNESKLPLEKAPHRLATVLKAYHKNLTVEPVPGTRMISIQFMDPDPDVSSKIVNNLVSDYTEQYFRIRYAATVQASDWLSQQLNDLKGQVESSQQKLADFQRQAGILGTDETHNIVMTRLEQIDGQLTTAQANRILAQAVWQLAQTGDPELLPGLVNVTLSAGSSTTTASMALIQTLRLQQTQLKLQYAEGASKYGSAYPKLIQMQTDLDQINATIQTEISNLASRAHNDFLASQQTQDGLQVAFEKAKQEANQQNDSAVQYTLLKHEVDSRRNLYDSLSQKLKEAGVLASLRSSNIVVIDPARPSDRPARPIMLLNLGLGLFSGLLCGVVGAMVVENMDETISSPEHAEEVSQVSSLGFVPRWNCLLAAKKLSKSSELVAPGAGVLILGQPHCQAAEAYRGLRTSIMQSTRTGECNVLLITSAFQKEGKTTTSINCAAAFAQQGLRVLLVEADLRRPTLCSQLSLDTTNGLSSLISGGTSSGLPLKMPGLSYLSIIPAGPRSGYPAEILGSLRAKALITQWRSEYDYIFIDTPPVLSVTDAAVLAPYCDGVILIARSGITTKKSLKRAVELFRRTQTRIVGTVLNAFDVESVDYHDYVGYKPSAENGNGYYIPEKN
jgi:capsular exopolysaccharide synthesis family protein